MKIQIYFETSSEGGYTRAVRKVILRILQAITKQEMRAT